MPGCKLQKALKPAKKKAQLVNVDLDTSKSDVGDVAKAVGSTKTPHRAIVAPSTALIVRVKGLTKDHTAKVRKALAGVKGVVADESRAAKGRAVVQLDPKGGARLADIQKALKKATE